MNTIKDKLAESATYLEEYTPQESLSKEERENNLLDNILDFQSSINKATKFYEKGILLIQKLSWAEDEGDFDEEILNEIKEVQISTERVIKSGIQDYVILNNNFRPYASAQIKLFKDALDEFKETTSDVLDKLLETRLDSELLALEEKIKNL